MAALPPAAPVTQLLDASTLRALDARAAAALLKSLHRHGARSRSQELFAAMRSAPPASPLGALAELYTYTTALSQCASAAQAQALFREMVARGVEPNVHAFSALLGVCAHAGDEEACSWALSSMAASRVAPNAVTCNILVDLYARQGRWREALDLLSRALQGGGAEGGDLGCLKKEELQVGGREHPASPTSHPSAGRAALHAQLRFAEPVAFETRTYDAVLGALSKAGRAREAVRVF
ncbi:hypothetical protein H632_c4494p0, partial [Helicosporidium sp. ATCC 50920]